MKYEIVPEPGYLRVELFDRQPGQEEEDFLRQIVAASKDSGLSLVLVHTHSPCAMPVFAYYLLIKLAEALSREKRHCIALVVESSAEVGRLQQFGAMVARGEEPDVMAFTDISTALNWLLGVSGQHAPGVKRAGLPASGAGGDVPLRVDRGSARRDHVPSPNF